MLLGVAAKDSSIHSLPQLCPHEGVEDVGGATNTGTSWYAANLGGVLGEQGHGVKWQTACVYAPPINRQTQGGYLIAKS